MTHNKRLEDKIWICSSYKYDKLYKGILICESHFLYTELGVILIMETRYPEPPSVSETATDPAQLVFCIYWGEQPGEGIVEYDGQILSVVRRSLAVQSADMTKSKFVQFSSPRSLKHHMYLEFM